MLYRKKWGFGLRRPKGEGVNPIPLSYIKTLSYTPFQLTLTDATEPNFLPCMFSCFMQGSAAPVIGAAVVG